MSPEFLEIIGKYAGLAGFSLGLIFVVFYGLLKTIKMPEIEREHAYSLLRLLIILTFTAGILGLGAWVYTNRSSPSPVQPSDNEGTISGSVTDGKTQDAVVEATVSLKERSESISTDNEGKFFLDVKPPVPKSELILIVRKKDFEPFTKFVKVGQTVEIVLTPLKPVPQFRAQIRQDSTRKEADHSSESTAKVETAVDKNTYDKGLRHFFWLYSFDPPGHQRRDWYQESASTWSEIYEDDQYNHSRVVDANAKVDGNDGIVCVADKAMLRLFIPNPNATGNNPTWLRIQNPGEDHWNYLAEMFWIKKSGITPIAQ